MFKVFNEKKLGKASHVLNTKIWRDQIWEMTIKSILLEKPHLKHLVMITR